MAGIIFVIIVIVLVATSINKGRQQAKKQRPEEQEHPQTYTYTQASARPQQSNASHSQKKPAQSQPRKKKSYGWEYKNPESEEAQITLDDVYDKNHIVAAAKVNTVKVALGNDEDAKEDLMQGVYEAMVKGPKDNISFERDFLSEGIDMLNSFQIGKE